MDLFIARQPIFDTRQIVYAYELLFRSGPANVFPDVDQNHASACVIADSLFNLGLGELTGGQRAFFNITRDILVGDYPYLLPRETAVIELLESIVPDDEVVTACARLKEAGYMIALDDFVDGAAMAPLIDLADIIKVDFLATEPQERHDLIRRYRPRGIHLLAEKVETVEEYREAVDLGYAYFQGYFFSRPAVLRGRAAPEFRLTYVQLLQEAARRDLDMTKIAGIVARDVTLSYKLLRHINSITFGFHREVVSIPDALFLLGERQVKQWASLVVLVSLGANKPPELVMEAALRAKFCEELAPAAGLQRAAEELFLIGLFSLIDAMLDRPLEELLRELPLPAVIRETLLGRPSPLQEVYQCALAYVRGDWQANITHLSNLHLPENEVPRCYREALSWAQRVLGAAVEEPPTTPDAPALAAAPSATIRGTSPARRR